MLSNPVGFIIEIRIYVPEWIANISFLNMIRSVFCYRSILGKIIMYLLISVVMENTRKILFYEISKYKAMRTTIY